MIFQASSPFSKTITTPARSASGYGCKQMGFEPSGVARGASGSTHPEVQALGMHHHTFLQSFENMY